MRYLALVCLLACAPPSSVEDAPRPVWELGDTGWVLTEGDTQVDSASESLPSGFSWVDPGVLAAMPYPYDLAGVADQDIRTLVSLTETPLPGSAVNDAGMAQAHFPIVDFTAPTLDQMIGFTELVESHAALGHRVGVHCAAGLGRSGTMAAAWFIHQGMTAEDALDHIRLLRPGSVETTSQEDALQVFEAWRAAN